MILSYINLGIGNLIPFFYTPIMLELLGQSEYGLYKIASSTTSYLSLMAFGIGSAVSRFIIKARTQEGKEAEERMFGLFNLLFQAVALLTLIVGGIITWKLDLVYGASLTDGELYRMRVLVALMGINTAVSFSATSYNAVVSSHERFLFIHSINILSTIGAPVLNLVVLFMGYHSVGMAVVSLSLNVVIRILYVYYVGKKLHINPKYHSLPWYSMREIFVFSFWVFLANITSQLYSATDTVIIGMIPSLATIGAAVYSIGITFPNIMSSLSQAIPTLYMPTVNRMVFENRGNAELTDLLIRVGRLQGFIVSLVCSGFISFGQPFIYLYAGAGYEDAYDVALLIMIPYLIPLVQSVANSIIHAKAKHSFRAITYVLMAVANVFATWILVQDYGIIGAAIPSCLTCVMGNGLLMNWYYWKVIGLDIPRFWKNIFPVYFFAAIPCTITLLLSNIIDFYPVATMFSGIVCYTIVYVFIFWKAVLRPDEKQFFTSLFSFRKNKE